MIFEKKIIKPKICVLIFSITFVSERFSYLEELKDMMYIYTHTHTHTHTHIYIYIYTHTHTHTHIYIYIYTHTHTHTHTHTYIYIYIGVHIKYPLFLSFFMNIKFSRHCSEKYSNIKFHDNPSSGGRTVPCGQTKGRTGRHDEAKSNFSKFCERT